jgi:predicted nucleic acid-binding Zn ribbon protein
MSDRRQREIPMGYDEQDDDLHDRELPDASDQDDDDGSVDTVACPSCGADVYEQAERCPHCGQYQSGERARPQRRGLKWLIAVAFVCLLIVLVMWTTR